MHFVTGFTFNITFYTLGDWLRLHPYAKFHIKKKRSGGVCAQEGKWLGCAPNPPPRRATGLSPVSAIELGQDSIGKTKHKTKPDPPCATPLIFSFWIRDNTHITIGSVLFLTNSFTSLGKEAQAGSRAGFAVQTCEL